MKTLTKSQSRALFALRMRSESWIECIQIGRTNKTMMRLVELGFAKTKKSRTLGKWRHVYQVINSVGSK